MIAVITPFRPGCPYRERNWRWVKARYERLHGWPIHEADVHGVWSKGAAVNAAVAQTTADVLVLADADSFVLPDVLAAAVDAVTSGDVAWAVPHHDVLRLSDGDSLAVMAGEWRTRWDLVRPVLPGPAGGGITVITRDAFDTVHGIDDRFTGWGGEDVAFGWALETLVGPYRRIGGELWHLDHPTMAPEGREPEQAQLRDAYRAARYVPRLMRALVEHRDPDPDVPLTEPRTFRSATATRTIRVGTKRARFRNHLLTTTDRDIVEALSLFANVEEVTPCSTP